MVGVTEGIGFRGVYAESNKAAQEPVGRAVYTETLHYLSMKMKLAPGSCAVRKVLGIVLRAKLNALLSAG